MVQFHNSEYYFYSMVLLTDELRFPSTDSAENYQFNKLYNMYLQVEQDNTIVKRDMYSSISWVLYPLVIPGTQVLQTDATMKLRVNKEYKDLFAGGFKANDTSPKYSFDIRMEENTSGIGTINNEASVE